MQAQTEDASWGPACARPDGEDTRPDRGASPSSRQRTGAPKQCVIGARRPNTATDGCSRLCRTTSSKDGQKSIQRMSLADLRRTALFKQPMPAAVGRWRRLGRFGAVASPAGALSRSHRTSHARSRAMAVDDTSSSNLQQNVPRAIATGRTLSLWLPGLPRACGSPQRPSGGVVGLAARNESIRRTATRFKPLRLNWCAVGC